MVHKKVASKALVTVVMRVEMMADARVAQSAVLMAVCLVEM